VVVAVGARALGRVLGHAQLLLQVRTQCGQLRDLGHDRPHPRQLAVGLLHRVRAEPLHGSTILPRMDAAAMRKRLEEARVAHLATADTEGRPHVVPIAFAHHDENLYFVVDDKPKRSRDLKRLRNLAGCPPWTRYLTRRDVLSSLGSWPSTDASSIARPLCWPVTARPPWRISPAPPASRGRASTGTSSRAKPCSRRSPWPPSRGPVTAS